MSCRNGELFPKVNVSVNLSPGQPKVNGTKDRIRFLTHLIKTCLRCLTSAFVLLL